ncbi:MAG: GHKL domain-containing protein [Bacilli bacterium]|nr:GHKL domain-containing protein [Bacilli bacterium]
MDISFLSVNILNSFAMIFAATKLLDSKINYRGYKFYLVLTFLTLYSFIMYQITHSFLRIAIIVQLYIIGNWFLHRNDENKIDKIMICSLLSWIIFVLTEVIIVLIASLIWQIFGLDFIKDMMGSNLTAVIIILIFILIMVNNKALYILKNLVNLIAQLRIKKLFLTIIFVSTLFSSMLYLTYFELQPAYRVGILLLLILEYTVFLYGILVERRKIVELQEKIDTMITVTSEYEKMLEENRINNHENKNQLIVIKDMIDSTNKCAIAYINKMIKDTYKDDNNLHLTVSKIPLGGLRGLIYYKLLAMKNKKIDFIMNIDKSVEKDIFKNIDAGLLQNFCKVIGVFLDNAIEAVTNLKPNIIGIEMYKEDNYFVMSISNEFVTRIDFESLGKKKYSSKGENRGDGLRLVDRIIKENEDLIHEKVVSGNLFTQKIKMNLK